MISGILIGFFLGSLLPGYWIGKFVFAKDLRDEGSGNIGATNAFRVLGPKVGSLVLCMDIAKGSAAVWIAKQLGGIDYLAGLAAILGHTFSPFLKFRGGKGVATGLGVFLVLLPKPAFVAFCVFVIAILLSRRVSIASCVSAVALGISVLYLHKEIHLILIAETVVILVLFKHISNIRRLLRGEEPPLF